MNSTDDMNRVRWLRLTPRQRETITAQIEATRAAVRQRKWALIYTHPSTRSVHVRASVEALAIAS